MQKQIKKWLIIISIIWSIFWITDILLLVPISGTFTQSLIDIFTDKATFSITWLFVTAPIQIYILFIIIKYILNKINIIKS
jgi:hypothetical protein